jgi:hypothetical protein
LIAAARSDRRVPVRPVHRASVLLTIVPHVAYVLLPLAIVSWIW